MAHKESDPNLNKQNQPLVVIFFFKKKLILAQYIIKPGLNQVSNWPKILLRFKLKIKWNLTSNLDNLIYINPYPDLQIKPGFTLKKMIPL